MDKIVLLSNVTIDMIAGILKKEFDVYVPDGFDAWQSEIADGKSEIYSDSISAIYILLYIDPFDSEKVTHDRIEDWMDSVRYVSKMSSKPIFVSSLDFRNRYVATYDNQKNIQFCSFEEKWEKNIGLIRYNGRRVYLLPLEDTICTVGRKNFYSDKMWYVGNMPYSLEGIKAISEVIKTSFSSIKGMRKKCLALDLDGTLWGGVVGEDGWDGIEISDHKEGKRFQDAQKLLLEMKQLGVILIILSKNNPDDVKEVFANNKSMILKDEDFVFSAINWEPKYKNLQETVHKLNIGLDSVVFLDDNPVEREQMKVMCPEVTVIDFPKDTSLLPELLVNVYKEYFKCLSSTKEDAGKTEMYHNEILRAEVRDNSVTTEDYVNRLDIKVDIHLMKEDEIKRVVQLANKTNQFNTTTRRYTEEEIISIQKNGYVITGHMRDKFGDEGLVAVMTLKPMNGENLKECKELEIDDFLMSCRVMGRNFERVIMNEVCAWLKAKHEKISRLTGRYIPTKKNAPVNELFDTLGFVCKKNETAEKEYVAIVNDLSVYDEPYSEVHAFEEHSCNS